ncbi:MAG: hypothetical protein ACXW15_09455 [Acidimicrobiia bacterium]
MTTIKTTCERCGDVELEPSDLALELDPTQDSGVYLFTCPNCIAVQRRPANPRVVNVLLATGVSYEVVTHVPIEDPITEAEIDAFVSRLYSEEDLFRLLTP